VIPDERQQVAVDRAVRAVKAGTLREARGIASELGKMYERLGIDALLLACTELPIAFAGVSTELSLVDPTEALARACVAFSLARIGRNAFESK
jgi:aspartate racemase